MEFFLKETVEMSTENSETIHQQCLKYLNVVKEKIIEKPKIERKDYNILNEKFNSVRDLFDYYRNDIDYQRLPVTLLIEFKLLFLIYRYVEMVYPRYGVTTTPEKMAELFVDFETLEKEIYTVSETHPLTKFITQTLRFFNDIFAEKIKGIEVSKESKNIVNTNNLQITFGGRRKTTRRGRKTKRKQSKTHRKQRSY